MAKYCDECGRTIPEEKAECPYCKTKQKSASFSQEEEMRLIKLELKEQTEIIKNQKKTIDDLTTALRENNRYTKSISTNTTILAGVVVLEILITLFTLFAH